MKQGLFKKFTKRHKASSLIEYAILVGLIGVVVLLVVSKIGASVNSLFTEVDTRMTDVAESATGGGSSGGDTTPPSITSAILAGSSLDDLVDGNELIISLTYDEVVIVSGAPNLPVILDSVGGLSANYMSGSGSMTLFFAIILPSDQATYANFSTSSIANALNITDAAGNISPASFSAVSLTGIFSCVPPFGVEYVFDSVGVFTWTTPCTVTVAEIELWGAGSGGSSGGGGGGGGKCSLGGSPAGGGGDAGVGVADGGLSKIRKSNDTLIARGGAGNDWGRPGGGGGGGHTTTGAGGSTGRGGFAGTISNNFIRTGLGITTLLDAIGNNGVDGIDGFGATGGAGGFSGAAHVSNRSSSEAGAGGAAGSGGGGGNPEALNVFIEAGGPGGAGGGGAGGGGGGYIHVRNVPTGASLQVTVGGTTSGQGSNTGGTAGVGGDPCPQPATSGDIGFSSSSGADGLVIIIPHAP